MEDLWISKDVIIRQYFKDTYDIIAITMAMRQLSERSL